MYAAGQWIVNLNYWGCNQYITQRALGADLNTARTGLLFAALLKLIMPLIVMLPGIAAYVLMKQGHLPSMEHANMDHAYSAVLGFLPAGLKGLVHRCTNRSHCCIAGRKSEQYFHHLYT